MREAGLEAKWGKTSKGTPIIFVRDPSAALKHQRDTWWVCSNDMWERMKKDGVKLGFDNHTLLGDVFSIAV